MAGRSAWKPATLVDGQRHRIQLVWFAVAFDRAGHGDRNACASIVQRLCVIPAAKKELFESFASEREAGASAP